MDEETSGRLMFSLPHKKFVSDTLYFSDSVFITTIAMVSKLAQNTSVGVSFLIWHRLA
jgi:hypothetical protein